MEAAEADVYPTDRSPVQFREPGKSTGRKWVKHWVPQETVLGAGTCVLLKWITEDVLDLLQAKNPETGAQEPQEEHEIVYLCTFEGCGKIFPDSAGLRKHAHIHGEKQYICHYEGCGKRFMDSSKLKRHFLIHTGEKHFICPFEGCGKAFSLDFNLRSHMRSHTGEKYHVCHCGKRYAHEYKLKAHMKSFHVKSTHTETKAASPVTDPEREIIVPKYVPERETVVPKYVPPPPAVAEKPYACPFEGCSKRYIHEYKLNLHFKNAHMMHDIYDDSFRNKRGGQGEDDIEEESEQDRFQELVPKYYEQIPKVVEPVSKRRAGPKASGKGKLRIISKPVAKTVKRKRANVMPSEPTLKPPVKQHGNAGRSKMSIQEFNPEVAEDSEETEDEDRENTEDDNAKHIGVIGEEDDEETEDDM